MDVLKDVRTHIYVHYPSADSVFSISRHLILNHSSHAYNYRDRMQRLYVSSTIESLLRQSANLALIILHIYDTSLKEHLFLTFPRATDTQIIYYTNLASACSSYIASY